MLFHVSIRRCSHRIFHTSCCIYNDHGLLHSGNTCRSHHNRYCIEEETTDSEGNTSTTTYFKGRIIAIEYPKETSYVRLTSKKFHFAQGLRKRDYPEVDTENVSFNKAFKIVAESPVDAFYLLTPPMMEKLQYIISRYGNLGLCCYNHMLYMAINTKRNAFDTGV
ncbi:MAG TPA: hypothetical protein DCY81_01060, partial [Lachnospiraceae bacterium]|nr:hypothetical protein [Lachnospiraceae bacterium]